MSKASKEKEFVIPSDYVWKYCDIFHEQFPVYAGEDETELGTHTYLISRIDGSYVGVPKNAYYLESLGIAPQQAKAGDNVASIGFSSNKMKWYGWSHRAIVGFGIGSKVSKGDIAYSPSSLDDFVEDRIRFWSDASHEEVASSGVLMTCSETGSKYINITWRYSTDPKLIPNVWIRGQLTNTRSYLTLAQEDGRWGRGEWVAETLDDAKQMAIDFAEGVA